MTVDAVDKNCLFCKIANKEIQSSIIEDSEEVLAFWDINKQAPSHFLIIPKKHIPSFSEISADDSHIITEILKIIRKITKKTGIIDTGYRVVVNNGKDAGQAVNHLHFHVLGGRKLNWPPG